MAKSSKNEEGGIQSVSFRTLLSNSAFRIPPSESMLRTLVLDTQNKQLVSVSNPDRISDLCAETNKIVWVDVNDPTGEDFAELADEFNFHPLAIEDCRLAHQRPKIEEYQNCYFIVLYEAELVNTNQAPVNKSDCHA